jgi:uncharacterized protein with GYD domain
MPRYLWRGSYSADGTKGLLQDGGTGRQRVVQGFVDKLGGKLEAFYFSLGDDDVYVIAEVPDQASAVAVSLAVNATGAVRLTTTVLLSPEEMDAATRTTVDYRAPGR